IDGRQFDTIYHEHFSYFTFRTAVEILRAHGLVVFDVEELPTHGGSLRVSAQREETGRWPATARVGGLNAREDEGGYGSVEGYAAFADDVAALKRDIVEVLGSIRREGKAIAGYGAPGKGNTLLNYCGIRTDLVEYTVDRNPYKQGKFLPGTHIP